MNLENSPNRIRYNTFKYMSDRSIPGPILLLSFFLTISYATPIHLDREFTFNTVFALLAITVVIRGINEIGFNKIYPKIPSLWPKFYFLTIAFTAFTWGMWCLDTVSYYGINWVSLMVLVCTAGVSAGGILAVIPNFKLSLTFQSFILLPVAIYSFSLESGHAYTVSYLFLCYLIFMSGMAWKLYGEYWKSVENEHLLNIRATELTAARDTAVKLAKSKSNFLATMSHEVRTPLNGILGMSQLLKESKLDNDQKENLDIIVSSTSSLLNIVNDILDFSKYDTGSLATENKVINLNDFCIQVKNSFKSSLTEKNIDLIIDIAPNCPTNILSDEIRLNQVLTNLIGNAIKFSQKANVFLTIHTLKQDNNSTKLRFEVIDSGIGIPENMQSTIFESFTQADASTTRNFGGTGLGLAICKKIVDLFNGEIGVISTPNKGSTFWFELTFDLAFPADSDDSKTPCISDNDTSINLGGKNILIAEDNEVNVRYAKKLLEKCGAIVTVAENGLQAVEHCLKNTFDIILMDCQMPELDGFKATQNIRHTGYNKQVPILAVSANSHKEDVQRCYEFGMNDFIAKPFTQSDLLNKIAHYLKLTPSNINLSTQSKPNKKKVDLERIKELKVLMDDEYASLVDTFLSNTQESIESLSIDKEENNTSHAVSILHSLKSATKNMGAVALSYYISSFESELKSGKLDVKDLNITKLNNELEIIKSYFHSS